MSPVSIFTENPRENMRDCGGFLRQRGGKGEELRRGSPF